MSARDFVEGEAMLDDDEDEELADDYDGQGPEPSRPTNHYNDSSEEDEDDEDEDAARAVWPQEFAAALKHLLIIALSLIGSRRLYC